MADLTEDEHDELHDALLRAARPVFAKQHPSVVGSVLAELTGIWLAGHPENFEKQLLTLQDESTEQFAALYRNAAAKILEIAKS